jgi:hypothetical protein
MKAEIDMSPKAISRRLEDLRQLYKLALYLRRFSVPGARKPAPKSE